MSSSNLVSVIYADETVYGTKDSPLSGVTANTALFIDEGLSGTPSTTKSQRIRADRNSAGQVVTGLEVGGPLNFELAPDQFFDDWFEAGMMTTWVAAASSAETVTLTPDGGDDQLATLTIGGDFSSIGAGVAVGDILQLLPASGAPVMLSVITVNSTTSLDVATKRGEAAIVAGSYDVSIPAHLDIGTAKKSFTVGKAYKDVIHTGTDEHSQTYTGFLVSGFTINSQYGRIVEGSFNGVGNGYEQESPSYEQQIGTAGGTITAAGTTNSLNASVDVPIVTSDGLATEFCIESFGIELDNGLSPQNCIGKIAPTDYNLGEAGINLTASIYLSDSSYDAFMPAKLSQVPISMTFVMLNAEGGYALQLAAVQLSFPDPASSGPNTQTTIEAAGQGKVGANGESALRIWKLVGDQ